MHYWKSMFLIEFYKWGPHLLSGDVVSICWHDIKLWCWSVAESSLSPHLARTPSQLHLLTGSEWARKPRRKNNQLGTALTWLSTRWRWTIFREFTFSRMKDSWKEHQTFDRSVSMMRQDQFVIVSPSGGGLPYLWVCPAYWGGFPLCPRQDSWRSWRSGSEDGLVQHEAGAGPLSRRTAPRTQTTRQVGQQG